MDQVNAHRAELLAARKLRQEDTPEVRFPNTSFNLLLSWMFYFSLVHRCGKQAAESDEDAYDDEDLEGLLNKFVDAAPPDATGPAPAEAPAVADATSTAPAEAPAVADERAPIEDAQLASAGHEAVAAEASIAETEEFSGPAAVATACPEPDASSVAPAEEVVNSLETDAEKGDAAMSLPIPTPTRVLLRFWLCALKKM